MNDVSSKKFVNDLFEIIKSNSIILKNLKIEEQLSTIITQKIKSTNDVELCLIPNLEIVKLMPFLFNFMQNWVFEVVNDRTMATDELLIQVFWAGDEGF